jgi:hypothetical protein
MTVSFFSCSIAATNPSRFVRETVTDLRKNTNDGIMKVMEDIDGCLKGKNPIKRPKFTKIQRFEF